MAGARAWWERQQWGPLATTTEYRRDRVVALVEKGTTVKPTEEEWRLASAYVSWRRRQLWTVCPTMLLFVGLVALVPQTRPYTWNAALIMVLSLVGYGWRILRLRRFVAKPPRLID